MYTYLAGSTSCMVDSFIYCPPTLKCWVVKCELWWSPRLCAQGMGYNGVPMGNMSNQQLMQMQLHGMDLQRMGAGYPGDTDDLPACLLLCVCMCVRACMYVCTYVCMYVCMPWLCERSESSPMNGCECVTCCAVIVRQVSNAQHWLDFFCAHDRLKCDWWCTHQFRHAPGAGHGCWCSSVLECWRATGTPASDSPFYAAHYNSPLHASCSKAVDTVFNSPLHSSCSKVLDPAFFENCCRASWLWLLKLLLRLMKL